MTGSRVFAMVLAAGNGTRFGTSENKVYLPLGDRCIVSYSLCAFQNSPLVEAVYCVVRAGENRRMEEEIERWKIGKAENRIVVGGEHRFHSVLNGLEAIVAIEQPPDVVMIHDGARPFFDPAYVEPLVKAARERGAAVVGYPAVDTLQVSHDGETVSETPPRHTLWQVQTPQAFRYPLILRAYRRWDTVHGFPTDDATVARDAGHDIHLIKTPSYNIKITDARDFLIARALIEAGVFK